MPGLRRGPSWDARRRFSDAAALERHALVAQLTREAQDQELPRLIALQRRRRYLGLLEELQDDDLKVLLASRSDAGADRITQHLIRRTPETLASLRSREAEQGVLLHTSTLDLDRPEDVAVFADCLVVTRVRRLKHTGDSETVPFHSVVAVEHRPAAATLQRMVLHTTDGESVLVIPRRDASALLVIVERWQQEHLDQTAPGDGPHTQARSTAPGAVQGDLTSRKAAPLHVPPPG